jgi:major vault protein
VGDNFFFSSNNLLITNVDVQSVEPVDTSTRESLQKSVQLAIEITTKSQEARATFDAQREEVCLPFYLTVISFIRINIFVL